VQGGKPASSVAGFFHKRRNWDATEALGYGMTDEELVRRARQVRIGFEGVSAYQYNDSVRSHRLEPKTLKALRTARFNSYVACDSTKWSVANRLGLFNLVSKNCLRCLAMRFGGGLLIDLGALFPVRMLWHPHALLVLSIPRYRIERTGFRVNFFRTRCTEAQCVTHLTLPLMRI
jgi:hypothetical protein